MQRYAQKDTTTDRDTTGADSLEDLAELFKLLAPNARQSGWATSDRITSEQARAEGTRRGTRDAGPEADGERQEAPKMERAKPARRPWRKSWHQSQEAQQLRSELDEIGLAFRLCKSGAPRPEGWMRAVRQAIGLPAVEVARRMGVTKGHLFKLEESEQQGNVRIGSLRRAAEAMGCELVYALVPSGAKLASMAAAQRAEEEARAEQAAVERNARRKAKRKQMQRIPRGETIREECERLGIAGEIYGQPW